MNAETAAKNLMAKIDKFADAYLVGLQSGMDERDVFNAMRDMISKKWNIPELAAANIVRLAAHRLCQKCGEGSPFTAQDVQIIMNRALLVR